MNPANFPLKKEAGYYILFVISVLAFIQDQSPSTMVTIIIVLGALVLNVVYFKQENK